MSERSYYDSDDDMRAPTPGWCAPDVLVDDMRDWADHGREFKLSKRTVRALRRVATEIERLADAR